MGQIDRLDWNVHSGELFANALAEIEKSFTARPPGTELYLAGLFWIQGESDAKSSPAQPALAVAYEDNLKTFIGAFREAVARPRLPVVIARIAVPETDATGRHFGYRDIVRNAQYHLAASDPNTTMVNTDDLTRQADDLHFDAAGQLELGKRLFDAWWDLFVQSR